MKLTINTDDRYVETEIIVNCCCVNDDVKKIIASIQKTDMKIAGQKDGRKYIIDVSDIHYIESIDRRTFLYTFSDIYETNFRLYELEIKLAGCDFIRASRNCLINLKHIKAIDVELYGKLILLMPKNIELIATRQYSSEIKQKLEAYHV
jgi:DNA-binding LytR/AlgR family response regulator